MNNKKIKKVIGIIIMLVIMVIPTGFVFIHEIFAQSNIETNEQIDLTLGAIEALDSVTSIPDLIFVMETLLRVPISELKDGEPPYNQEPPDAQQDFRRPTNMPPTMAPPTQPPPTMIPPPTLPPPTMMAPPTLRPTAFPTFQPPPTRMPTPPTMRPTRRPFLPTFVPVPPTLPPTLPPTQPPPPPTQNPNNPNP